MKVFISSDSTCDLSPDLVREYNISIMPLYIQRGDESLRDGVDITPKDIFAYTEKTGRTAAFYVAETGDGVHRLEN